MHIGDFTRHDRSGRSPLLGSSLELARYLSASCQDEHPNVIAEAALAFLAESLANHPNRDEMVQHVLDQLRTIVDQIAEGEPGGSHQGSA